MKGQQKLLYVFGWHSLIAWIDQLKKWRDSPKVKSMSFVMSITVTSRMSSAVTLLLAEQIFGD